MDKETKVCVGCGEVITRRDEDNDYRWNKRLYCKRGCSQTKIRDGGDKIFAMYSLGASTKEIALAEGITTHTVCEKLREHGIDFSYNPEESIRTRLMANREITETNCWEWTGLINKGGYGITHFDGGGRLAHRVSYMIYVGEIPDGLDVCHSCDNRKCINPEHLFAGTRLENMQDAVSKGRQARGNKLPQTKLTEDAVVEMRTMRESGAKYIDLADKFGVSFSAIAAVITKRTWGWLNAE